jgi:hypothetical protein
LFVLSGGALTISIGIFLRPDAPVLTPEQSQLLKWSWTLLFGSIFAGAVLMLVMICQGYADAAAVIRKINSGEPGPTASSLAGRLVQQFNWLIGISGVVAFLFGLGLLAYVSVSAITQQRQNPPAAHECWPRGPTTG